MPALLMKHGISKILNSSGKAEIHIKKPNMRGTTFHCFLSRGSLLFVGLIYSAPGSCSDCQILKWYYLAVDMSHANLLGIALSYSAYCTEKDS